MVKLYIVTALWEDGGVSITDPLDAYGVSVYTSELDKLTTHVAHVVNEFVETVTISEG